uniref:Transmembrane 9 superfamily member n=1 Tax=Leersia perrieri TaxID=77586 RepID=A0A0D9XAQ9_9ORYZ
MAMTMLRSLHREIFRYSQLETQNETQAETGWKLVHGDVFRSPSNPGLLCAFAGSGVQLFGTLLITVVFEFLGFFSSMTSAGVRNAMLLTWVLMGLFAGYTSSRLSKMFNTGSEWKHITLTTAILFPGFAFVIFQFLNNLLYNEKSSATIPSTTMCSLVLLWFCVAPPLVYVGGYLGFKKPAIEPPVEINKTLRKIPKQAWYTSTVFAILIGSIFPFATILVEFFFGLIFFWYHKFYRGFGFLLITFVLLVVACAEIPIVLCYYQLRSGNYKWWWRSFLTSGCSAVYLFLYATFFFTKIAIVKPVSAMLYFGHMLVVSYAFFLLTGTIGFFSCFFFTSIRPGDEILVKVNDLTSIKTQIPYSYYSLPFCKPDIQVDNAPTLWRFLLGDRQQRSPFLFEMKVPKTCQIVCRVFVGEKEAKELIEKVENQYRVNMALDNLPLTIPIRRIDESGFFYQHGYHIGVIGRYAGEEYNRYFIHNHLSFLVKYERDLDTGASRIVAFETKPFSIKHKFEAQWNGVNTRLSTCDANANKFISASDSPQEIRVGEEIIFTYDVSFQDSEIKWASRWDAYLSTADDQARWFSIVNSLVTLLVLSVAMATTMLRSLHREIFRYSLLETTQSETQAETRWKLVHGDVFRPPSNSGLLCAFAGSGVQLFGTLLITVAFEFLGFFSPMNPAGVRNFMILTWVLMGLFAGYTSSCLYKMFKNGSEWKHVTLTTAFLFPGFALVIYLILNDLLEYEKSSAAVPNSLMFVLVMSSCITWPLVYVGGYLGFKKTAIEPPVEINETPRKIPKQKCCAQLSCTFAAIPPPSQPSN